MARWPRHGFGTRISSTKPAASVLDEDVPGHRAASGAGLEAGGAPDEGCTAVAVWIEVQRGGHVEIEQDLSVFWSSSP
jgi:hypothetical protein